jgi:hypothetical protein
MKGTVLFSKRHERQDTITASWTSTCMMREDTMSWIGEMCYFCMVALPAALFRAVVGEHRISKWWYAHYR